MASPYEVHVDASDALLGLDRARRKVRRTLPEALDDLGLYAQRHMLLYVHGSLAEKISRSLTREVRPGEWEKSVGAEGPHPFPLYVHEGTGVHGRYRRPITARADRGPATVLSTRRARLRAGGVLRFIGRDGAVVYRRSVAGQRPNPFVRRAHASTSIYANARVQRLGREIVDR